LLLLQLGDLALAVLLLTESHAALHAAVAVAAAAAGPKAREAAGDGGDGEKRWYEEKKKRKEEELARLGLTPEQAHRLESAEVAEAKLKKKVSW
jgi:uncharacterized protein (DUF885 family)